MSGVRQHNDLSPIMHMTDDDTLYNVGDCHVQVIPRAGRVTVHRFEKEPIREGHYLTQWKRVAECTTISAAVAAARLLVEEGARYVVHGAERAPESMR